MEVALMIRWGHFSDLHFQFDKEGFDTQDLRKKLIDKIETYRKINGKFDYLFITGDILHKGNQDIKEKKEIIEYLLELAKAAECEEENVILCAGNHDLKRFRARKNTLDNILKEYKEEGSWDYNGYCSIVVNDVCTPFKEICQLINHRQEVTPLHYFIPLENINLYVLNTSVFAGQTYPGEKEANPDLEDTNLYICDTNLYELKNKVKDLNDKLNIVIAHHGVECFEKEEQKKFLNFLRDLKIDLYLCGHVHKTKYRSLDEAGETKQCSCGGLFVDTYNSPSFYIDEYDQENHLMKMKCYEYILNVNDWRPSNSLPTPFDDNGEAAWKLKRFQSKNTNTKSNKKTISNGEMSSDNSKYAGIVKVSTGFDRDKEFIEIRERATQSITILGVGMSKLSKYALYGTHSLEKLLKRMDVELMMYDPAYLEENEEFSKMLEDFFGIGYFAQNVRTAYDTLVSFCKKHNNDPKYKHKITLYTYTTVPTMSAVIIDEQSDNGELVLEHFGYHSGQNRPLFLVKKVEQNSLFDCIKEQINMLKEYRSQVVKI